MFWDFVNELTIIRFALLTIGVVRMRHDHNVIHQQFNQMIRKSMQIYCGALITLIATVTVSQQILCMAHHPIMGEGYICKKDWKI